MEQVERWQPERWQVKNGDFSDLGGGDLVKNLQIMRSLLKGNAPDSLRNTVLVNASTAFWIQGKCASLEEGIELADSLLINGTVEHWLEKVSDFFK
jgi:anthranilate phosphoribosyltransferase